MTLNDLRQLFPNFDIQTDNDGQIIMYTGLKENQDEQLIPFNSIKFGVFDNNKPCSKEGFPGIDASWDSHLFDTFEEAHEYALRWLAGQQLALRWLGGHEIIRTLELNKPHDYNGFGDLIEIRDLAL